MTKSSSAAHVIANRYATALIETAETAKALDSVEKDMSQLAAMLEQSDDLKGLISSPLFNREQQQSSLAALGKQAGFNQLTINFLGVLAQNRRLYALSAIINAFRNELSKRRGEVRAQGASAFPLTNFATVKPGMDKLQVRAALGRPARSTPDRLQGQEVWDWRYRSDPQTARLFSVWFDTQGRVVRTASTDDPDAQAGPLSRSRRRHPARRATAPGLRAVVAVLLACALRPALAADDAALRALLAPGQAAVERQDWDGAMRERAVAHARPCSAGGPTTSAR